VIDWAAVGWCVLGLIAPGVGWLLGAAGARLVLAPQREGRAALGLAVVALILIGYLLRGALGPGGSLVYLGLAFAGAHGLLAIRWSGRQPLLAERFFHGMLLAQGVMLAVGYLLVYPHGGR